MLADHTVAIAAQVGDANPRMAVADARRELPTARIIDAPAQPERVATPGPLMRLIERYALMPAPVAAGR